MKNNDRYVEDLLKKKNIHILCPYKLTYLLKIMHKRFGLIRTEKVEHKKLKLGCAKDF